ncbi:MAG TPA: hypothetical protein VII47_06100 [Actinomycetota bacterium]
MSLLCVDEINRRYEVTGGGLEEALGVGSRRGRGEQKFEVRGDVGLLAGLRDGSGGGAAAGEGRGAARRAAGTDHPEGGIGMSEQETTSTGEGSPLEEALRGGEQETKGEQEYVATSGSSLGSEMDQEVELQEAGEEEQQGERPERIVPREG